MGSKLILILLKNPNFNTDNESIKGNKIRETTFQEFYGLFLHENLMKKQF